MTLPAEFETWLALNDPEPPTLSGDTVADLVDVERPIRPVVTITPPAKPSPPEVPPYLEPRKGAGDAIAIGLIFLVVLATALLEALNGGPQ
jgi:hypothetical protein